MYCTKKYVLLLIKKCLHHSLLIDNMQNTVIMNRSYLYTFFRVSRSSKPLRNMIF
jgi:hypothetical protein